MDENYKFIDAHVNIHHESFDDHENIFKKAEEAHVKNMIFICDEIDNIEKIININHYNIKRWYTLGIHPHYVMPYKDLSFETFSLLVEKYKPIAIGETGIDLFKNFSNKEEQIKLFKLHISVAKKYDLPLIIHNRGDDELMKEILSTELATKKFKFLMHCYTGSLELLDFCLKHGGYFSYTGIVTFKNAVDVRENVLRTPMDNFLIETDCPYLSPVPYRGKRNEPSFLPEIYKYISELKEVDLVFLCKKVTNNFESFFDVKTQ